MIDVFSKYYKVGSEIEYTHFCGATENFKILSLKIRRRGKNSMPLNFRIRVLRKGQIKKGDPKKGTPCLNEQGEPECSLCKNLYKGSEDYTPIRFDENKTLPYSYSRTMLNEKIEEI